MDLKKDKLNPKQELFCHLYASDREFFGNGVQSYLEAYKPSKTSPGWYKSAQGSASDLLSKPIIFNRINELLEAGGLNDQFVDKQLLYLIGQHEDKNAKTQAIREYNKLKKRISDREEGQVPLIEIKVTDERTGTTSKTVPNIQIQ